MTDTTTETPTAAVPAVATTNTVTFAAAIARLHDLAKGFEKMVELGYHRLATTIMKDINELSAVLHNHTLKLAEAAETTTPVVPEAPATTDSATTATGETTTA